MSGLEIVPVDPFDDEAVDAWHAVYEEADRFDRGELTDAWLLEETRPELQQRTELLRRQAFLARVDGTAVGCALMVLPLSENRHRAELGIHVAPAARRRGVGSAVLERLVAEAKEAGRTVLGGEVTWPYASGPEDAGHPGAELARRHGFDLVLVEVHRTLDLPVDEALLDRLAAEAAAHHQGYTVRAWVGPVPDDLVEGYAVLEASLETEAPLGGLDVEAVVPDVARVREMEELLASQGRTAFGAVALDPAGVVVAYTMIQVDRAGRAFQWGTLVRGADRGHRLGLAVKVANHRMLQDRRPDLRRVSTYNAEVNAHMVAVNELLGFRPVERLGEFQRRL